MPYPAPADVEAMEADPDITVMSQEGLNVGYLALQHHPGTVRQRQRAPCAQHSAIDKQAIIDVVFQGSGSIAKNPIPPTMWSYREETVDDPYDPERGAPDAAPPPPRASRTLSMKVWAMPVQRPYNPNARRMAELIQADMAEIGVDVEIVSYEWGEYLSRSRELDRDGAILLGWTGDNGDPDNFLAVLLGCDGLENSNRAQWCYEPFDDIVQQAKTISDQEERAKLYEEAQAHLQSSRRPGPRSRIRWSSCRCATRSRVTPSTRSAGISSKTFRSPSETWTGRGALPRPVAISHSGHS